MSDGEDGKWEVKRRNWKNEEQGETREDLAFTSSTVLVGLLKYQLSIITIESSDVLVLR